MIIMTFVVLITVNKTTSLTIYFSIKNKAKNEIIDEINNERPVNIIM